MKNTMYLFGLLLLAGAIVVSSCKKDDDDPTPVDLSPVMTFIGGAGYTDSDAEMAPSSAFKVGINASENPTSKSDIKSYVVVRTFNNTPTTVFEDNSINESTYTKELDLLANTQSGEERWTFTITDKDGLSKQLVIMITTVPNVTAYKNVTMGSFNEPTYGSFMATSTGTVLTKAEASADQGSVDFAFYLGAINKSTFGAPSNADVKSVFELAGSWTIFNNTLFQMAGINAAEFDAIGDSYMFPQFTGTEDDINNLEADDVVFFKTVNDKLGYIKVNTINGKGDQINIDVIVQE
jgi:hypothetical protein